MKLALKLPRRNPDAPRPSLHDRLATLKGTAAKVIGKGQTRHRWPRLAGGGEPSKAMAALIEAHQLAYARCLHGMGEEGTDMAALRAAEEEAFRALLHAPLTSDADRGCYAAAVIERENGFLVRGYAGTRNDPLSVAYRNLRFGENAREPDAMRHVGRPAEPNAAADPILATIAASHAATAAFDAYEGAITTLPSRTTEMLSRENILSSADLRAQKVVWQTVPTTPAGRRALVEFARSRVARNTHPDGDVDDASYLFGLVFDAFAAMVAADEGNAIPQAAAAADPILAAIEAHRIAHAAWYPLMCAWNDMTGGTPEYEAAEAADEAARRIEREAFRALLNTQPTTVAGCLAFTAYLSGTVIENDHHLDGDTVEVLRALRDGAASLGTDPTVKPQAVPDIADLARLSAEQVDLSRLDVFQLSSLFEAFQVAKFSWEGVVARPYSSENEPGEFKHLTEFGEAAEFEEQRAAWIADRIEREIAARKPEDNEQRDEILMVRTQQEFRCNARIHDSALLLDIARAWIV